MWTSDKSILFSNQLDRSVVNNIKESLSNSENGINCILNKIEKLFKDTANQVLGHECEYQIDANAIRKPIKFNRETLNARNKYYKAKKQNDGTVEKKRELSIKSKA